MRLILILEDNAERQAAFHAAVAELGSDVELRLWRDALSFIAEAESSFSDAVLISLDHDLNPQPGATRDPGTGLDAAAFLADCLPVCPIIIHSSNTDRAWSMHNELRFASWPVERVGPLDDTRWIGSAWLAQARAMMAAHRNTHIERRPTDHAQRMARARLSLDGLGLGDAIGEMCAYQPQRAPRRLRENDLPAGLWFHTDDTEMAISIYQVLRLHGFIQLDALARRFARRFERDCERGYGRMTRIQLQQMLAGEKWQTTSANAFGGQGSMGNGAAMRVGPLGAYFAGDLARVVEEARQSAIVTHTHPEGVAGAIAIAAAAALADRLSERSDSGLREFWEGVLECTPESRVRRTIALAQTIPFECPPETAAKALGNGSAVTAPDTVPYALWCAARHGNDFAAALGAAIQTGGDCDTNAAIVGGIVSLAVGREGIPDQWLAAREPLGIA
jgi:ADP-ribosylglycohydrolase